MSLLRSYLLKMSSTLLSKNGVKPNRPFTVSIEGNVGSGKTTFINYFKKFGNISTISEPLEMWRDCKGNNLLANFYKDPKKFAFTFQSYVQLTMVKNHLKFDGKPIKLMERSVYSARYCFTEKLKMDGVLSPPEFTVLDEWFQWITENNDVGIDLIIYLRTSPEVVYQRIIERNRSEEKAVPFSYIEDLHNIHEDWLYYKTKNKLLAPVFVINADLDKSTIGQEYNKCEAKILNSLEAQV